MSVGRSRIASTGASRSPARSTRASRCRSYSPPRSVRSTCPRAPASLDTGTADKPERSGTRATSRAASCSGAARGHEESLRVPERRRSSPRAACRSRRWVCRTCSITASHRRSSTHCRLARVPPPPPQPWHTANRPRPDTVDSHRRQSCSAQVRTRYTRHSSPTVR